MTRMTQADIDYLVTVIASALPGSTTDPLTIPQFRDRLQQYRGITSAVLRQHLIEFLARVDAGGRAARRDADAASGRSAAPAVRPAAHRFVSGRLPGAVRCRALEGERHLPVHGLARRARGKRSSCDGETICAAHRLRAFAGDQTRGRWPVVLRIRPSGRRRRHDRGAEGIAHRESKARPERPDRVPARITAIACSTISPKPSAPIPATPRSAGCAALPNCAAPSAPSSTPVDG